MWMEFGGNADGEHERSSAVWQPLLTASRPGVRMDVGILGYGSIAKEMVKSDRNGQQQA